MTYRYKNGLHEETTQFTYWLFFTHLFLILHSQTLQSLITCRPVPVLFLQVHGWLTNVLLPQTFSPDVGKSKCSSATSYSYISGLEKLGAFGIPNWILRDTKKEHFKSHKTVTVLGKSRQMGFLQSELLVHNVNGFTHGHSWVYCCDRHWHTTCWYVLLTPALLSWNAATSKIKTEMFPVFS